MRTSHRNAFTLIELLVVISIIAILAGIALPVFGEVQTRGAQTKALSNAKQVGLACKIYAQDYNGQYPFYTDPVNKTGTASDANAALETLIPDYVTDKTIFAIPKSAYCKNAGRGGSSNATKLGTAESEWGYMIGLSDTSNARFPLIADGCASGGKSYVEDETAPGGVWKGKKAVVIRVDVSGAVEKLYKSGGSGGGGQGTIPRDDNPKSNALEKDTGATPPWLPGNDVQWLNPTS